MVPTIGCTYYACRSYLLWLYLLWLRLLGAAELSEGTRVYRGGAPVAATGTVGDGDAHAGAAPVAGAAYGAAFLGREQTGAWVAHRPGDLAGGHGGAAVPQLGPSLPLGERKRGHVAFHAQRPRESRVHQMQHAKTGLLSCVIKMASQISKCFISKL